MAFEVKGAHISFDSEELIEEVREEIKLYGREHECFAFCREVSGVSFVTDYCLTEDELNDSKLGLASDEVAFKTTLDQLLSLLVEQDTVL